MTNDINEGKILMTPGDVCTLVGIKESTLRKYALILQDAGYHFHTNSKGQRGYYDNDVTVIRRFIDVKKASDMTLEQSANAVIAWVEQSNASLRVIKKDNEKNRYVDDVRELKETVGQQNILLQELVKKMEQQHLYYEKKFEDLKYDRDLVHSLRSNMEQRKLESSERENKATDQLKEIEKKLSDIERQQGDRTDIKELSNQFAELSQQLLQISAAQEEEKKKSFFARLFGK
jgi:DNA-binding transcriptional MerR regulator